MNDYANNYIQESLEATGESHDWEYMYEKMSRMGGKNSNVFLVLLKSEHI